MSDERELKLQCLKLAGGNIEHAKDMFDWLAGPAYIVTHTGVGEPVEIRLASEPATPPAAVPPVSGPSFSEQINEAFQQLAAKQEPLGAEFEKVLHENMHKLYEYDPAPLPASADPERNDSADGEGEGDRADQQASAETADPGGEGWIEHEVQHIRAASTAYVDVVFDSGGWVYGVPAGTVDWNVPAADGMPTVLRWRFSNGSSDSTNTPAPDEVPDASPAAEGVVDEVEALRQKIRDLANLEADWDDNGGGAVPQAVIDEALRVVDAFHDPLPRMGYNSEEIILYYNTPEREQYASLFGEGYITALKATRRANRQLDERNDVQSFSFDEDWQAQLRTFFWPATYPAAEQPEPVFLTEANAAIAQTPQELDEPAQQPDEPAAYQHINEPEPVSPEARMFAEGMIRDAERHQAQPGIARLFGMALVGKKEPA